MLKVFLVLVLLSPFFADAQQKESPQFVTRVFGGLLEGEQGSAFQLQAAGGIYWQRMFAGVGTGLDYYGIRSVPVYLSFSKGLEKKRNHFIVHGDAGINIAWENVESNRFSNVISTDFKPGLYWNGAVGYITRFGNSSNALMVSLGYSYKHLSLIQETATFCTNPPCTPIIETRDHYFRRLSIKLGWQFAGN